MEKLVPTRMRAQSCRHLRWRLSCGACLAMCLKNFSSATAQFSGRVVLLVNNCLCLLDAHEVVQVALLHPKNHLNQEGSLGGISDLELAGAAGGQHH